jgi:hypothetical protein
MLTCPWHALTDLLISVTFSTGFRRLWLSLGWHKCLPSCQTSGFPIPGNFESKPSVSASTWSTKSGNFTSLWIYLLPVYQGVLITFMSDILQLDLENDPLSTYHLSSSVVQPDHTRAHPFFICALGLQAQLTLKPSCFMKLFRCSHIYVCL